MTATHRALGQTGYQPTDPPRDLVQLRADIPYLTRFVLLRQLADTVVSEAFFGINDDLESTATHTLQTTQRIIEILCEEGLSSNALSTLNKAGYSRRTLPPRFSRIGDFNGVLGPGLYRRQVFF